MFLSALTLHVVVSIRKHKQEKINATSRYFGVKFIMIGINCEIMKLDIF